MLSRPSDSVKPEPLSAAEQALAVGDADGTVRAAARRLGTEPHDSAAWTLIGLARVRQGRYVDAAFAFGKAAAFGGGRPDLVDNLHKVLRLCARRDGTDPRERAGWPVWKALTDNASPRARTARPASHERSRVHLINPMMDPLRGAELKTIEFESLLSSRADVTIWSDYDIAPRFLGHRAVRRIDAENYPRDGIMIFVGVFFDSRSWLRNATPEQVVVDYHEVNPLFLMRRLGELSVLGRERLRLLFVSEALQRSVRLPGGVMPSPIDVSKFPAAIAEPTRPRPFTIGRVSRDSLDKHHPGDSEVYRHVVETGGRARVMGGRCIAGRVGPGEGLTLLDAGAEPVTDFLGSLDVFFYRTGEFFESYGRVVAEAMLCALPVVVHRTGGYAALVRHGENGFLFDTTDEAIAILNRLREEPRIRQRIGRRAREDMLSLYDERGRQHVVDALLG